MCKSNLLLFHIVLKHREVVNVAETICILLKQIKTVTKLGTNLSCKESCLLLCIGDEENRIKFLQACEIFELLLHIIRNKLVDWSLVRTIFQYFEISESAHTNRLRELQHLLMLSLGKLLLYCNRTNGLAVEWCKCTSLEELCHIDDLKWIAKIRLICTIFQHCFLVADDWVWCFCNGVSLRSEFLKCCGKHFLANLEYVFLCCKAHLEVELIELTWGTVGSCILITEARCNLEIFIKSGHHQKLLVLLWCLWECIELTLVSSGWYDIITCALRRRCTKDWCLNLHESHLCHLLTQE